MSFMAAMTAAQMSGGGGGGGGGGLTSSASSSADMGDDYSRKTFQSATINGSSDTNDLIRWGLFALAAVAVVKVWKG